MAHGFRKLVLLGTTMLFLLETSDVSRSCALAMRPNIRKDVADVNQYEEQLDGLHHDAHVGATRLAAKRHVLGSPYAGFYRHPRAKRKRFLHNRPLERHRSNGTEPFHRGTARQTVSRQARIQARRRMLRNLNRREHRAKRYHDRRGAGRQTPDRERRLSVSKHPSSQREDRKKRLLASNHPNSRRADRKKRLSASDGDDDDAKSSDNKPKHRVQRYYSSAIARLKASRKNNPNYKKTTPPPRPRLGASRYGASKYGSSKYGSSSSSGSSKYGSSKSGSSKTYSPYGSSRGSSKYGSSKTYSPYGSSIGSSKSGSSKTYSPYGSSSSGSSKSGSSKTYNPYGSSSSGSSKYASSKSGSSRTYNPYGPSIKTSVNSYKPSTGSTSNKQTSQEKTYRLSVSPGVKSGKTSNTATTRTYWLPPSVTSRPETTRTYRLQPGRNALKPSKTGGSSKTATTRTYRLPPGVTSRPATTRSYRLPPGVTLKPSKAGGVSKTATTRTYRLPLGVTLKPATTRRYRLPPGVTLKPTIKSHGSSHTVTEKTDRLPPGIQSSRSGEILSSASGNDPLDSVVPGVCQKNPCKNGGLCLPENDESHKCACANYYGGNNCETLIDKCGDNGCDVIGDCLAYPQGALCICNDVTTTRFCKANLKQDIQDQIVTSLSSEIGMLAALYGIMALLGLCVCIRCLKANSKRKQLRKDYMVAIKRGEVPNSLPSDFSTLCCICGGGGKEEVTVAVNKKQSKVGRTQPEVNSAGDGRKKPEVKGNKPGIKEKKEKNQEMESSDEQTAVKKRMSGDKEERRREKEKKKKKKKSKESKKKKSKKKSKDTDYSSNCVRLQHVDSSGNAPFDVSDDENMNAKEERGHYGRNICYGQAGLSQSTIHNEHQHHQPNKLCYEQPLRKEATERTSYDSDSDSDACDDRSLKHYLSQKGMPKGQLRSRNTNHSQRYRTALHTAPDGRLLRQRQYTNSHYDPLAVMKVFLSDDTSERSS